MKVFEKSFVVDIGNAKPSLSESIANQIKGTLSSNSALMRIVVVDRSKNRLTCEAVVAEGNLSFKFDADRALKFRRRSYYDSNKFNVIMMIPTGIGAEIGGHSGDGGPASKLIGATCDKLVLHPNVVNGSDLNEQSENSLYVEGSVLTRLLLGNAALREVRSNRILLVCEERQERVVSDSCINMFNGSRATCGINNGGVLVLKEPFHMKTDWSGLSGRASGVLSNLGKLLDKLYEMRGSYDAIALSSNIDYHDAAYCRNYFKNPEGQVNPMGSVEALLTHTISTALNVQSAHSPQAYDMAKIGFPYVGITDPRVASEVPSVSFLYCILKGLNKSPQIVDLQGAPAEANLISAENISCVVQPDRCLGVATFAALEQGIPVIAVKDEANVLKNNLDELPWAPGQLHRANSYFEAAGILTAMKAGIGLDTVKRPIIKAEMIIL